MKNALYIVLFILLFFFILALLSRTLSRQDQITIIRPSFFHEDWEIASINFVFALVKGISYSLLIFFL